MRALFGRKVLNLNELERLTREARIAGVVGNEYKVIKEIELTDEEFNVFTKDFTKEQSWIRNDDGGCNVNGQLRCIRIKNKITSNSILVDPEGYEYPRYIAIEK